MAERGVAVVVLEADVDGGVRREEGVAEVEGAPAVGPTWPSGSILLVVGSSSQA